MSVKYICLFLQEGLGLVCQIYVSVFLQEEMDMEFALSLQNMENRPPTDPTSSGGTTTRDEDSDTRAAL